MERIKFKFETQQCKVIAGIAILLLVISVYNLWTFKSAIGGVDFYYYALNGRDLIAHPNSLAFSRYSYFPGVYRFWQLVFLQSRGTLGDLQNAFLAVLLLNGLFIGLSVFRASHKVVLGCLAAAAYNFTLLLLEGTAGTIEPIATLPFLMGLYSWLVLEEKDHRVPALIILGLGIGGALFFKQQAGLQAIGYVALVMALFKSREKKVTPWTVMITPLTSLIFFFVLIFLEGGGMSGLGRGLWFAQNYEKQGSGWDNLKLIQQCSNPLFHGMVLGFLLWLCELFNPRLQSTMSTPHFRLLGFASISCLATLIQFRSRGYPHYAMLSLPLMTISSFLAADAIIRLWKTDTWSQSRLFKFFLLFSMLFLATQSFPTLPSHIREIAMNRPSKSEMEINSEKYDEVCRFVKPGERLLLIPPRENRLHWHCGTFAGNTPWGYGWPPIEAEKFVDEISGAHRSSAEESPSRVFFARDALDLSNPQFSQPKLTLILNALKKMGYESQYDGPSGILFSKN